MTGAPWTDESLPVRLVSRLTTELGLMNLPQAHRLVLGRLETAIVGQALLRGALPLLTGSGQAALPTTRPLIGSISSVARSFARSPETIRRHVHALVGKGYFAVEQDGVRLAPSAEAGERILAYLRRAHDHMLWLVEELDSWGLVTHRTAGKPRAASFELIVRTAMDLRLHGVESFRGPLGGWTSMALWNALSAVSVRHITIDRRLSGMFTRESTPDALRRPTSARVLSAMSGLPYATVWRLLAAHADGGTVARRDEGYVMLTGQLLTPEIEGRVRQFVRHVLDRVDRLVAAGVDPGAIPSLYLGGRPELVPIG